MLLRCDLACSEPKGSWRCCAGKLNRADWNSELDRLGREWWDCSRVLAHKAKRDGHNLSERERERERVREKVRERERCPAGAIDPV